MKMNSVRSSMIKAVGYDSERSALAISFHNGSLYEYFMVPEGMFREFMAARSKGTYFLDHLKDGPYAFRCVRQGRF